jgi:subtilase family serine protease
MKRIRRVVPPVFFTALFSFSLFGFAQRPTPRLTRPITQTSRATLAGSRSPRALRDQDLGAVSPQMTVTGITLVFKRSVDQENALQELLTAQQNPASPFYHRWLTPDTFAARFGMADEDIAATETWLQSRGFHVESTGRGHDRITFSGNAGQVQAAFGAELHYYQSEGEIHFAPQSDLTLPTELASMTAAVLHLSSFRPKSNIKVQTRPQPDFTALSTQAHYLGPEDVATMYDLKPLYTAAFAGEGQSLAVVGQSFVSLGSSSDVGLFHGNLAPGATGTITSVLVPGSGVEAISPGDELESEIDLEYSSGIATEANIFLVYVGDSQNYDVFDALAFAIAQNIAPVVSISYGTCESLMSATDLDQGNALFEQAAAQGQTLIASAGDSGSTACAPFTSDGLSPTQEQALNVVYPADSPYVTAVGGTQMAPGTFAAGSSQYWTSAVNANLINSLLSYVPEVVWNEGSLLDAVVAGGGGASTHFPRPTWQNGAPGISSGTYRLLPDIALQASVESPGFLICSSDPTLGTTGSCANGLEGTSNKFTIAGGTSFSAPIFAGLIAILNQAEQSTGQGNINPVLYGMASNPTSYASVFHDITSGSNACIPGTPSCAAPGELGYAATPGYDEATGLGSIDFGNLVKAWPASATTKLMPTNIVINAEAIATPGTSVPIQIMVESVYSPVAAFLPTGGVAVSLDGTVIDPSLEFPSTNPSNFSSTVNYTFTAPSTAGSHLITVNYPGDATHSPSVATYSVLVGNVTASGGFGLSAGNLTVASGSSGSTQVTVTPTGGYNGRVVWSLALSTSDTLVSCYSINSPLVSGTSTTTLTIGIAAACNASLPSERSNLRPLATRAALNHKNPVPWHGTPSITTFAGLLVCCSLRGLRRKMSRAQLLIVALLTTTGMTLIGCGGANGSGGSSTSPPPPVSPSYTITLTGTDSVNTSIKASTTFTLTVN